MAPDDDALGRFAAALDDYEPAVAAASPTSDRGPRYEVTLWLEAVDPSDAVSAGREAFRLAVKESGLPDWPLVRIGVMSEPAFDTDLDSRALPPLLGVSELGDLLGVSRQRASIVAKSPTFPRPVTILQAGPVWTEPSVRRFIDEWERKPGRPRRDSSTAAST